MGFQGHPPIEVTHYEGEIHRLRPPGYLALVLTRVFKDERIPRRQSPGENAKSSSFVLAVETA
ncbi:hypothetical protein FA13DRAFT_1741677 [Coprinellus micaceus]|uniref:Uncharacterized protein n=1 Tax=Coprinellus micaceus TaxID=71717 RepID=A0A4Y7SIQ4_COPMI|nr:hypothetical protein FA13DRAFT_1742488 [Coprinellus micaceus]TEB21733.1 hypothetical protein FA13DRAFT_1741677 [Coprinellus micaceus]